MKRNKARKKRLIQAVQQWRVAELHYAATVLGVIPDPMKEADNIRSLRLRQLRTEVDSYNRR